VQQQVWPELRKDAQRRDHESLRESCRDLNTLPTGINQEKPGEGR